MDYSTSLEYDASPMKVGEVRKVRIFNQVLGGLTGMKVLSVSDNLSYEYEKGSDKFTITALAEGKAKMSVIGDGCTFGDELSIDIIPAENVSDVTTAQNTGETTTATTSAVTTTTLNTEENLPQTGVKGTRLPELVSLTLMLSGSVLAAKAKKKESR